MPLVPVKKALRHQIKLIQYNQNLQQMDYFQYMQIFLKI